MFVGDLLEADWGIAVYVIYQRCFKHNVSQVVLWNSSVDPIRHLENGPSTVVKNGKNVCNLSCLQL